MYCLAQGRSSVSALATSARQIHASVTVSAPRSPLEKLGNVVIPSREEFLKKSGKVYVPDLTYLKNAPGSSLASKLLRSATGESAIPPTATKAKPAPTQEKLQELVDQRRKERFNRSLGPAKTQINDNATKLQAAASLSREIIFKTGVSALPPAEYQRVVKSSDRLRKERTSRRPMVNQVSYQRAVEFREADEFIDEDEDDEEDDEDDEDIDYNYDGLEEEFGSCLPNFPGPQELSSNLCEVLHLNSNQATASLSTPTGKYPIPQHLVSSFNKRDYSDYVTVSDLEFAQTPKQLGAVKGARIAVSHNPHYPLPQRKHTLRIVENAVATQARARAAGTV